MLNTSMLYWVFCKWCTILYIMNAQATLHATVYIHWFPLAFPPVFPSDKLYQFHIGLVSTDLTTETRSLYILCYITCCNHCHGVTLHVENNLFYTVYNMLHNILKCGIFMLYQILSILMILVIFELYYIKLILWS